MLMFFDLAIRFSLCGKLLCYAHTLLYLALTITTLSQEHFLKIFLRRNNAIVKSRLKLLPMLLQYVVLITVYFLF